MSETSDSAARAHAVDPLRNVVLEASAGTGKTRVLVERFVNLLRAGVDPDHILAITFTRKAAAEMRERILERLREASRLSEFDRARWHDLRNRLGDIAVSTIDAFCLSLLREFPLEADIDPGFDLADDTEAPRLIEETLDQSLRVGRSIAREDDDVALVFAQLGEQRLRSGLAMLLERRLVAPGALRRYLASGPRDLSATSVCLRTAGRLREIVGGVPGGVESFLADGPLLHPQFAMLADDLRRLCAGADGPAVGTRDGQAALRHLVDRMRAYFLTQDGRPRGEKFAGTGFTAESCASGAAWKRHRTAAASAAPLVAEALLAFRRDLNVVLSRGVWRLFAVTLARYQRTLEGRALLDFSGVLERAIRLLKDMDEFAQSRFTLEARYRHILVDEFQDTSRAQWELVAQLVRTWGEGLGASADAIPSSIFIVGDRKQSIYGFRDAEVAVLDDAAEFIAGLRPDGGTRRAISVSFRAVPAILAFVNDLFAAVDTSPARRDAFRYEAHDRFPVADAPAGDSSADTADPEDTPLGMLVGETMTACADGVASEVVRLLSGATTVRDRASGLARPVQAGDMAILFRSRDAHREFEKALERRGVPTYVYKGLGFFDADEVQDAVALLRYLADPLSDLRTAALLRSRLVRLSDVAIARLAPHLSVAVLAGDMPSAAAAFSPEDADVFARLRRAVPGWLAAADRVSPADLLRRILAETGYAYETRGARRRQSRENLKKLAAMVRRFQNRGYATLARVADHLADLAVGDESHAAVDASDAVSLMTVHAAKGLEFPVVFVVNMHRGTGNARAPIRVVLGPDGEPAVAIADYQSEADEDAVAREREETKRLLYVALTRARDRIYLSATAAGGVFRTTRGSLGDVLPPTMKDVFATAATAEGEVTWMGAEERVHRFRVAGPPDAAPTADS